MVEHLRRDYCVAYFYCSHEDSFSETEVLIASSLLRQIAEQESSLPRAVEELHAQLDHGRRPLRFDDVARLLSTLCANTGKRVCILLDGLDECSRAVKGKITSLIGNLGCAGAKAVITSRPHIVPPKRWLTANFVTLEIESDISDIRAYVEHMIDQSDDLSELLCEDMRDEIVERVAEQANKM